MFRCVSLCVPLELFLSVYVFLSSRGGDRFPSRLCRLLSSASGFAAAGPQRLPTPPHVLQRTLTIPHHTSPYVLSLSLSLILLLLCSFTSIHFDLLCFALDFACLYAAFLSLVVSCPLSTTLLLFPIPHYLHFLFTFHRVSFPIHLPLLSFTFHSFSLSEFPPPQHPGHSIFLLLSHYIPFHNNISPLSHLALYETAFQLGKSPSDRRPRATS